MTNADFVVTEERARLARQRRRLAWKADRLERWEHWLKSWCSALVLLGVLELGVLLWVLSICNERLHALR